MAISRSLFRVAKFVGLVALFSSAACSGGSEETGSATDSVSGTLVQMIGRGTDETPQTLYFLKTKSGMTRLRVDGATLARFKPNSKVTVSGSFSANRELVVDDIKPLSRPGQIEQPLSSSAPKGKAAIFLIKDPGMPDPFPPQAAIDEIFSSTNPRSTSSYFQQASFGAMGISGDVFGWYSVAMPPCDQGGGAAITGEVEQLAAQQDGFVTDNYRHAVYLFRPNGPDCALAFGSLGAPDGIGQVWSWLNDANVMVHEFGHNLGLHHANSFSCQGSAFETVAYSSRCRSNEYFDPWDAMGFQGFYYHFNSYSKQIEGWIPPARQARATAAGNFTLVPQESPATSGVQSLVVPIPNTNQAFHVEMRKQLAPFDNEARFAGAVLVRRVVEPGFHIQSNLVDMTPNDFDPGQASMAVGQVFQDPLSGIAITLTSRNATQAVVNVAFNAPRCSDGVENGTETGLDCGGLCGPCADGQQCSRNRDCSGHACQAGVCVASDGGLTGQYFAGGDFDQLVDTRVDKGIDFEWGTDSPMPALQSDFFTVRWTGKIVPPTTDTYTFRVDSDDGARLWVNNQLIIDRWFQGDFFQEGQISLTGGQQYDIRFEYQELFERAHATLAWSSSTLSLDVIPPTVLLPTPVGGCSIATALDLGPRNVMTSVPSNACVMVSQYPFWWGFTNGLVTLQSGTGTFPVPATWTDACTNASANFAFNTAWNSQPIGHHTSSCPALIQLNGNGSPLGIQWW